MNIIVKEVTSRPHELGESTKKTRVYFFVDGENVIENLQKRRSRPYNEYRKLLPEVLSMVGIKPQKGNWNQRAGCSCPCSPGFILEHDKGQQVFVTIGGED